MFCWLWVIVDDVFRVELNRKSMIKCRLIESRFKFCFEENPFSSSVELGEIVKIRSITARMFLIFLCIIPSHFQEDHYNLNREFKQVPQIYYIVK